jgi:hypothetical protein
MTRLEPEATRSRAWPYAAVVLLMLVVPVFVIASGSGRVATNVTKVETLEAVSATGAVHATLTGAVGDLSLDRDATIGRDATVKAVLTPNRLNIPVCIITPFPTGGPLISNFDPSGVDSISGAACDITNYGTFYVTAGDNQGTRIDGIQSATHALPRGTVRTFCNINGTADDGTIGWVVNGSTASAGNQVLTGWSSAVTWTDTLDTHTGDCTSFILQPQGAGPTNAWTPLGARMRQWRETIANLELFPATTPAAITGIVNDWNPMDTTPQAAAPGTFGDYSLVNASTVDASGATLTGMQHGAGAGGTTGKGEGQIKCLLNSGPGPITIPHHSGSSSPSNYFTNAGGIAIQIQVSQIDCFLTFGASWFLIGSSLSSAGIANNAIPKMQNLGIADSTSNELTASALLDNGTVTTVGPLQVADSANPTSVMVGNPYFVIAPSGTQTTPPSYVIEATSAALTISTAGHTLYGLVSLAYATNAAGTNVAIFGDTTGAATNYALMTQRGSVYLAQGGDPGTFYDNHVYFDENKGIKAEGIGAGGLETALTLCGGDFNGNVQSQIASCVVPSANHGTLSGDASNYQGEVTGVGANTSVTLTFGGGGFATTAHCHLTVEGSSTVGMQISTVSNTAPVFSCFTLATGVAANCPNFVYQCWGH